MKTITDTRRLNEEWRSFIPKELDESDNMLKWLLRFNPETKEKLRTMEFIEVSWVIYDEMEDEFWIKLLWEGKERNIQGTCDYSNPICPFSISRAIEFLELHEFTGLMELLYEFQLDKRVSEYKEEALDTNNSNCPICNDYLNEDGECPTCHPVHDDPFVEESQNNDGNSETGEQSKTNCPICQDYLEKDRDCPTCHPVYDDPFS